MNTQLFTVMSIAIIAMVALLIVVFTHRCSEDALTAKRQAEVVSQVIFILIAVAIGTIITVW